MEPIWYANDPDGIWVIVFWIFVALGYGLHRLNRS